MGEGDEETNGALLTESPRPETRSGMLVFWPEGPFPALSWTPPCPVLFSVEYLRKAGQEDFPLIANDSLGTGWPDLGSWDEGEVRGTLFPGRGGTWLGVSEDAVPCG